MRIIGSFSVYATSSKREGRGSDRR
jgi:hypothetical protein